MTIEIKSVWTDVPKPEKMQQACKDVFDESLDPTARFAALRLVRSCATLYLRLGIRKELADYLASTWRKGKEKLGV